MRGHGGGHMDGFQDDAPKRPMESVGLQQNGTVLVIERSGWSELLPEDVIR